MPFVRGDEHERQRTDSHDDEQFRQEAPVCKMYDNHGDNVNAVRYSLFCAKATESISTQLSLL